MNKPELFERWNDTTGKIEKVWTDPDGGKVALEKIRQRDWTWIAMNHVLGMLETLMPLNFPHVPTLSFELKKILETKNQNVPHEYLVEFKAYSKAVTSRNACHAENRRRINTTLWAEAYLRRVGELQAAAIMRQHNLKHWGIAEPASDDASVRDEQAQLEAAE